jgi:GNAT superfamily N-acetyltransferase
LVENLNAVLAVRPAAERDLDGWLALAREVEPLFGPMVDDPAFHAALRRAIATGCAFCIGEPGTPRLDGGLIVDGEKNEIAWLAVSAASRGRGYSKALLSCALANLDAARPVVVQTFDASVPEGAAARTLYRRFGFEDAQPGGRNPANIPTVMMVREPEI